MPYIEQDVNDESYDSVFDNLKKYILYKVINKLNNKVYIGQSKFTLEKRMKMHYSKTNNDSRIYFHRALNKYGFNNFVWEIIDEAESRDGANKKEKALITYYKSNIKGYGYNLTIGGDGSSGYLHTEEAKKKMKQSSKKRWSISKEKEKTSIATTKAMQNISESQWVEMKEKMSTSNKKRWADPEYKKMMLESRTPQIGKLNPMYGKTGELNFKYIKLNDEQIDRIKFMRNAGDSYNKIADDIGVSLSTLKRRIKQQGVVCI